MVKKIKYYIRVQKQSCTISNGEKQIDFVLNDIDGVPTINFESQISNFQNFEFQIDEQLQNLNLSNRPWSKNYMYFSVPNNIDAVQVQSYFNASEHIGGDEPFLLKENIAILLNDEFDKHKTKLLIGVFNSKIEFSVMHNLEFHFLKTYYGHPALLNENENLDKIINETVHKINSDYSIDEYWVVTGDASALPSSVKKYNVIRDKNALIVKGLKIAEQTDSKKLMVRATL